MTYRKPLKIRKNKRKNKVTIGIIKKITDDQIFVEIECKEACEQCSQKSNCSLSQLSHRVVEVRKNNRKYHINDKVELEVSELSICYSIIFAYVVPLLCVLGMLVVGCLAGWSESICGICSLSILPVYYLFLKKLKNWFKKSVTIKIK